MVEMLHAYDPQGVVIKTEPKRRLLTEQRESSVERGDSPFAVGVVYVLLSHPEEGVYVVQRANKREDPYLWSAAVAGHISADESPEETARRETVEELLTKIEIASSVDEYTDRLKTDPLTEHAIVRKIDFIPWFGTYRIDRITQRTWQKRTHAHIFAGMYRALPVFNEQEPGDDDEFSDGMGEARAVKIYQKEELQRLLVQNDPRFTHTLGVLVNRYHAFL